MKKVLDLSGGDLVGVFGWRYPASVHWGDP